MSCQTDYYWLYKNTKDKKNGLTVGPGACGDGVPAGQEGSGVRVDLKTSGCGPEADVIVDLATRIILQYGVRGCDVFVDRPILLWVWFSSRNRKQEVEGVCFFFLEIDHMTGQDFLPAAQVSFRVPERFQAHVEPKVASGLQGLDFRLTKTSFLHDQISCEFILMVSLTHTHTPLQGWVKVLNSVQWCFDLVLLGQPFHLSAGMFDQQDVSVWFALTGHSGNYPLMR